MVKETIVIPRQAWLSLDKLAVAILPLFIEKHKCRDVMEAERFESQQGATPGQRWVDAAYTPTQTLFSKAINR